MSATQLYVRTKTNIFYAIIARLFSLRFRWLFTHKSQLLRSCRCFATYLPICNPNIVIANWRFISCTFARKQMSATQPLVFVCERQKSDIQYPKILHIGLRIGVTRFELAASASLRRRSNQTEPHPVTRMLLYRVFSKNASIFFKFF